jgi:hypothetical protein
MNKDREPCIKCANAGRPLAIYELYPDGTKIWRGHLCADCEMKIARDNNDIKVCYPNMKFREIYARPENTHNGNSQTASNPQTSRYIIRTKSVKT